MADIERGQCCNSVIVIRFLIDHRQLLQFITREMTEWNACSRFENDSHMPLQVFLQSSSLINCPKFNGIQVKILQNYFCLPILGNSLI